MIYLLLAYEFFKIGIFSFGGGYATVPFLYNLSEIHGWYSLQELSHMIAVASITPGPVGINAATYAGFKTAGITGSVLATIFEMIPSFILIIIVSKVLNKFHENFYVKTVLETLKPIGCALLVFVAIAFLKNQINDLKAILLLILLFLLSWKTKKEPLFYMSISGIIGVIVFCLFV